jgi:MerR family redox-sensitive transcriptional activator SoxR
LVALLLSKRRLALKGRIGLLPAPSRISGRRFYELDVLDRLTVIRFGLNAGFSLKELSLLFANFGSGFARKKAAQGRLQELRALRARLTLMEHMLNAVKLCRCGTVQACVNRLQKVGAFAGMQWGEKEGQVR